MKRRTLFLALVLLAPPALAQESLVLRPSVEVYAAAVAETDEGLVGTLANVSITVADGGSGHVFIDTFPLTQVDMQGSARLAVKVAASIVGVDPQDHDVFFVVRSGSSVIGGPSAGAVMTAGLVAAFANLTLDRTVMMTGTINPDGTVGPVGGVPSKAAAAAAGNARVFLFPAGQEIARERRGEEVVEVNMTTYCEEDLGILCRPVVDVREAVLLMTGHDFRRPPPEGEVQDESFRAILRPKGETLLRDAESDLAGARARFDATTALDAAGREGLATHLRTADAAVAAARDAMARTEYYTAASKAFQASISARTVNWSVGHAEAADGLVYLASIRDATRAHVADVDERASRADWSRLGRVDGVGAAQTKSREARGLLEGAEAQIAVARTGDATAAAAAVYGLAYAWERADTVPFWLEIAAETPAGPQVAPEAVTALATDVADAAQEGIVYAQQILLEIGGGPVDQFVNAARLLNLSRVDLAEGNAPGALLEALEAEARAGLALTVSAYGAGEVPEALVDAARARAARAIADARADDLEPVLAVSYYEFADDVGDVVNELLFYQEAHAAANLQGLLAGVHRSASDSRFVGDGRLPDLWVPKEYLVAFFAMGLAAGVGVAVGLVVVSRDERLTE